MSFFPFRAGLEATTCLAQGQALLRKVSPLVSGARGLILPNQLWGKKQACCLLPALAQPTHLLAASLKASPLCPNPGPGLPRSCMKSLGPAGLGVQQLLSPLLRPESSSLSLAIQTPVSERITSPRTEIPCFSFGMSFLFLSRKQELSHGASQLVAPSSTSSSSELILQSTHSVL